ncbi:MAG: alpha/beta hydrolase [Acidobacteria bacterium]|nr:alpha/beta hydrolase [Acidobacteriota bacterium]
MKEYLRWGEIPTVVVAAGRFEEAASRGTILFFHGLGADKEANLKEYLSLSRRGFLVVGIDNAGHGQRRYSDFDARFGPQAAATWRDHFVRAVHETAVGLSPLIDALTAEGMVQGDRLGACGISMGACIVYRAMTLDKRIVAATAILGSTGSPHLQPASFFPAALLSQNAAQDEVVDPREARDFHTRLTPLYASIPDHQAYIELEGEGHMMSESGWGKLWKNAVEWFERFLPCQDPKPSRR